jgi:hypothetical protein
MIRHNWLFCEQPPRRAVGSHHKDFDYRQEDCVDPEKFNGATSAGPDG